LCYPYHRKMKIEELEGWERFATKADIKDLELAIKELGVEMREQLVGVKEQFQRIKLLIWLPVLASVSQIVVALVLHK
jgi:hypothetical protein